MRTRGSSSTTESKSPVQGNSASLQRSASSTPNSGACENKPLVTSLDEAQDFQHCVGNCHFGSTTAADGEVGHNSVSVARRRESWCRQCRNKSTGHVAPLFLPARGLQPASCKGQGKWTDGWMMQAKVLTHVCITLAGLWPDSSRRHYLLPDVSC